MYSVYTGCTPVQRHPFLILQAEGSGAVRPRGFKVVNGGCRAQLGGSHERGPPHNGGPEGDGALCGAGLAGAGASMAAGGEAPGLN